MRLICPNCGAQYAIDARVLPESGRDVQCSACRHTWFQKPGEAPTRAAPPATEPKAGTAGAPPTEPAAETVRRPVDPEVLAILREEAAREQAARRAERTKQAPLAAPPAAETPTPPPVDAPPATPLPDVAAAEAEPPRSGFARGFGLALAGFALLFAAYVYAGPLGKAVPALAGPLASYAGAVDTGRVWLDTQWRGLTGGG